MGYYNFTTGQGETFTRTVTWKINTTAVDITGYTARMQVRKTHRSSTADVSLTHASGLTLGGAAGTIDITITAATTAALTAGQYVYDLELVSASGVVTRVLEGTFTLTAEVTR